MVYLGAMNPNKQIVAFLQVGNGRCIFHFHFIDANTHKGA